MDSMFEGAAAFNQPLSFNTSKVTSVRVYICLECNFNNVKPDSDFLFSTQFIRWATCSKAQRPSINLFLSILLRLQMWVHMLALSLTTANEKPDSDFLYPTLQMHSMFYKAVAFNQDLRHFGDYFSHDFSQINLANIFLNSGCSNKNVPTSAAGPWCSYWFKTHSELRTAIQEYLSQGCTADMYCQARSDYGGAVSIVLRSSIA